ncbi:MULTISPECIES: HesB/IscA family protein [Bradyrhizobium]|uniref:Iron-sulfur cluster assembly accessory protein n=3 Tax=Bradyrhizobium TaxID=374 RepID=A0AAE5X8G7_9BRAD|nr:MULTISPECIES: iron-sulfur cluster assembly accessory protein [Bradyrhizobium]MCG2632632.1 iron-sulfur cluster assembly accessory protein [Bradyrhizobium zhengyangense]MCG2645393.1 iron-sulfur cluster assembly accessory protein [Bradyrhizobium zhengyangense]MCG2672865.1 iron-sulfur cluster assembly accessory protein [Bradyrhizobium zhengyangense]MDN4985683.1 iron-sulfur cluster assembly accessory protein [Bradyrhizobium sp. WYCCWR 13022]MDT4740884.1 iron-sulfur cluster assembly accessory pro
MIDLTESAVNAVKAAISMAPQQTSGLRIIVETGGCAGFKYVMALAVEANPDDTVIERHGVKLFVDRKSLTHLNGTTMDFVVGLDGSGFTFDNPNVNSHND